MIHDGSTETILTAAILIHAEAGSRVRRPARLFYQAFSGQSDSECRAQFDERQQSMIRDGVLASRKQGPSLTEAGAQRLDSFRREVVTYRHGLGEAVREALTPVAGEDQAAMFQGRTDALLAFLQKMQQWPMMKPGAETMETGLVLRMQQLIRRDPAVRTRNVRDLLDLTYSRAAAVKHEIENPRAPNKVNPKRIEWNKIDRGLFHGRIQAWLKTGPLHLNLLRINPKHHALLTLDCSLFEETDRSLRSLCKRFHAPCGTSGGFFLYSEPDIVPPSRRGDPVGLIVQEGVVTHPPVYARSALIQDRQRRIFIRRIGMKGITVSAGDVRFPVRKVNAPPLPGEISVFNRVFGDRTPKRGKLHFSVTGRQVVEVSEGSIGIPLNGFAVVVDPGGANLGSFQAIKQGLAVDYDLPSLPGVDAIVSAMAGGPALLVNGTKNTNLDGEQFGQGLPPITFCQDSSIGQSLLPRMAWGITAHHEMIACAVDGRNLERSVGMTLKQLASFLLQVGCVEAINLDGGSSKRMVVQGRTVDVSSTGFVLDKQSTAPKRLLSSAILVRSG